MNADRRNLIETYFSCVSPLEVSSPGKRLCLQNLLMVFKTEIYWHQRLFLLWTGLHQDNFREQIFLRPKFVHIHRGNMMRKILSVFAASGRVFATNGKYVLKTNPTTDSATFIW